MSSTPTQKPSVPLSRRQRRQRRQNRKQRKRTQRQQKLVRAVEAFNEVEAIDDAVAALGWWLSGISIEHDEATGERKPTFADAERYVTVMKMRALLEYHKSHIEGKPRMTRNTEQYRLHICVHCEIRAEQIKRQQRCQPELTADDERQIIRSVFETEHLITLLGALFRFERHDLVTELIEKARIIGGNDFARVDELKRLCVDKLFGMVVK